MISKIKKPLSVLLALMMVVSLFAAVPMTASAITSPTYSGGTGTETDPWLISTVNDWKTFATAVNDGEAYEGKYFRQTANLDLSAENGLAPVGNLEKPFVGNYNGGNYTISGASINSDVAGVFGVLTGGGTISDLKVTNVTITATTGDGGWDQAYAGGLVALAEDCTVTGCSVSNSNITANGSNTFAGAIVGFAGAENSEKTVFSKCASENNTVNTMGYGGGFIGAVVNDTSSDDAISFTDCYSANSTTDAGTHNYGSVGAFLGGSQGGNVTVKNCFVYDCNATATGVASTKGLFTGDTTYGTVKATNTYYYNNNALDINADSAISKSADEMKSLASALGEAFSDGALYPVLSSQSSHEHSFTYSASGDTITATCKNDGCDLTDSKVTLRIADPANIYYDDKDSSHHFTLVGLDDFNRVTGKTISVDNIVYYKGDYISQDIKNNRVKGTTYKAKLTVEGVTAEHSFKFTAKPVAHTHSFTYSANGSVITATCNGTGTCDLANKQATLTILAPACTKYNDGNSVEASIAGTIPGVTTPTIRYQKGSTTLSSAPSDAGTYSASITLGSATAKVNYTIEKADTSYTSLPTANTLTYNGNPQDLVSAGTTAGGQIAYTAILDPDREPDVYQGDMPYSFSIPQMDDAGTYYVWYKLEGGKNYNSIAADKLVVTIAQADIHPNVSLEGWTLGEPAKEPVVSGNSGNGTVTFKYKVKGADDSTYTEKVPTNAGDYTVKATISETENYKGGVATADFTISENPIINLFVGHSVSLGGDIGVNFYLNPAVINTYTGSKTVKFSWDGNETTVDVPATATPDGYKVTCNVVAAQMAHKIKAEVYVGDDKIGEEYYSVQDYAEKVFANPEAYDTKGKPYELKALAKALLNYGAMAQIVFDEYLVEKPALANKTVGDNGYEGVTADQIEGAIKGSASDLDAAAATFDAEFYTSSLIYLSRNTLRLYFTPTTYPGEMPHEGDFKDNQSNYYYYVEKENIAAAELDDQQTFTVGGTTFTFSALDYAKAVVNSDMGDNQKNLAKSLYLYNQAANAYFD